jgi:hypothetical protein
MKQTLLLIIAHWSIKIHNWAYTKVRATDSKEWIKGYREWKKTRCPHN